MKPFILRIDSSWATTRGAEIVVDYEEWGTLREAEDRAKALRKQGAKVSIYQEM